MKSRVHKDEDRSPGGRQLRCPTCKRIVTLPEQGSSAQARFFPFCSERCKLIDLGAWLDAQYRIPSQPGDQEDVPPNDDTPCPDDPS